MAKYTGNYTPAATKILKESDRIVCRVYPDGSIIITTGYVLFKMNAPEYQAIVQPFTLCDAGNWELTKDGRQETSMDFLDVFQKTIDAAQNSAPLTVCPLHFPNGKKELTGAISENGTVSIYNVQFLAAFDPSAEFRAKDAMSAAVAYRSGEPVGMILPIHPTHGNSPQIVRAVKAWFDDAPAAADDLIQRNAKLTERLDALQLAAEQESAALRAQLADMKAALEAAQAEAAQLKESNAAQAFENTQQPEPAAAEAPDSIVSRFTSLPGVVATVKGAQTATPVIWLSGAVEENAEAIRAAGAKWSGKKNAYYFRVA